MADFGVTATGYVVKTQADINAEAEVSLSQVQDPATGETLQANLSDPTDIVSQITAITLEPLADGFLIDQAAYNQFDPGKATEDALSSLLLINGVRRKAAGESTVLIDFTGDPSTQGTFLTGTIGTYAAFNAVSDGEFEVTIDGDTQDIVGLNFTGDADYDAIALTIQTGLQAIGTGGYTLATVSASSPTAPAEITITSGGVGDTSTVSVLSTIAIPAGTDISGVTYLNGTTGLVVPGVSNTISAGLKVSDTNRVNVWDTSNDFTFDITGIATGIEAKSEIRGGVAANAGTLTQLITSAPTIDTLSNPLPATVGSDVETDNTARRRRDLSTLAPSIGLVGSVDANLKATTDVTFSRVYNNITMSPDANGIPAKTMGCVVVGGTDEDIAQVIFTRSSTGTDFAGNTTVSYIDHNGIVTDIKFYRPSSVLIDIRVNTTLDTGTGVFPDNGADLIKQAIVDYSIGGAAALGITEGFDIIGFPPGQDVIHSRLYTPVNSVPGHVINTIELKKTAGVFAEADVPILFDEVSNIQVVNIEVVVV